MVLPPAPGPSEPSALRLLTITSPFSMRLAATTAARRRATGFSPGATGRMNATRLVRASTCRSSATRSG